LISVTTAIFQAAGSPCGFFYWRNNTFNPIRRKDAKGLEEKQQQFLKSAKICEICGYIFLGFIDILLNTILSKHDPI